MSESNAYAEAGVNIQAADTAIELMKVWIDKARRPEMIGGLGGFAGLFDASVLTTYKRPLLATSTDGVGTKVAIAQAMDVHDTIGFDLVGMVDSTKQTRDTLCTACFTGTYPIELPDESLLGKHLLESSIQAPTYGKALPVLNNP